ncbi:efflux RND transporter periplasmic adaptor subunit [Oleispirillum naphthae]|uniref:efflux RND transporter periplasmic adaptor subunit n=1 Tax=Oleispirillum naphthae TaxID=2838853 RepID=UPI0030825943
MRRFGYRPGLCAALIVLGMSCAAAPAAAAPQGRQAVAAPVVAAQAERRDVPRLVRTYGSVLASATAQIKSLVEGRVLEAFFTEGDTVKAGDLLFRIDPRPFQADLEQTQAVLARDQAQLDKARLELVRQKDLSKRGVASAQKFEQAQAEAKALAATVAADAAMVANARLKLGYTEIRAPFSGKTGPILIHPGNIVKANGDTALVTLSAIEPVRISVTVAQQQLPTLQARMREGGTGLIVSIPGDAAPPITARVDFVNATVDSRSGTIEVRATVENRDHRLVPGQFVSASLVLETFRDAVAIPFEAINTGQEGPYVYVVGKDGKAEVRPVTVLYADAGVAALGAGVEAGEQVVTDGQLRLAPGVPVVIAAPAAGKAQK